MRMLVDGSDDADTKNQIRGLVDLCLKSLQTRSRLVETEQSFCTMDFSLDYLLDYRRIGTCYEA